MIRALVRCYYILAYYLSWLAFAAVGLALNAGSILLLPFPHTAVRQRRARQVIRFLFDLWLRWFHASGVVRIIWKNFPAELPAGTIYVANHPTLVDAPVLLSRLPDAICIFKPALMRNPAVGPAAVLAGYAAGQFDVDLIRDVAQRVADGRSLLIFPEGTRTRAGTRLGSIKPGFALMANRAPASVQLVVIRSSAGLVPRGRAWWRPPVELPGWIELAWDRRWDPDPSRPPAVLAREIEEHLLAQLPEPVIG